MYRQPGIQDEDCYAVPGVMVLQTGIPQLPNVPARNPESVFFHADEVLYSEPPLFFYLQASLYSVLPICYGTARLGSTLSGLLIALLLVQINRHLGNTARAGYWAAGLFLFSRWFYFPAMSARPDMLCSFFGVAGVYFLLRFAEDSRKRWLVAIGIAIGLGGLTHPFAITYAIQFAVWVALISKGILRLGLPLLMALVAVSTTLLWLPIIMIAPDVFEVQFRNQFLASQEHGLLYRMVVPWQSLYYHFLTPQGMVRHIGIWQFSLAFIPVLICLVNRRDHRAMFSIVALSLSSVYLMSVFVGPHHPVIGYWSYSAALMFLCTGRVVDRLAERLGMTLASFWPDRIAQRAALAMLGVILAVSLVPGSGIRTWLAYVKHWNDDTYNAPRFAQQLIAEIPKSAVVAVDTEYLLDFVASGRDCVLLNTAPIYFRLDNHGFDYLVLSRLGDARQASEPFEIKLIRSFGNREDEFANYAEVYQSIEPIPQ